MGLWGTIIAAPGPPVRIPAGSHDEPIEGFAAIRQRALDSDGRHDSRRETRCYRSSQRACIIIPRDAIFVTSREIRATPIPRQRDQLKCGRDRSMVSRVESQLQREFAKGLSKRAAKGDTRECVSHKLTSVSGKYV